MSVQLSAIDEERFGVRTARAASVSRNDLTSVLDFCRANQVKFLIARCPADDLPTAQMMEGQGFLLVDTLVYYARPLALPIPPSDNPVRPVGKDESEQVKDMAGEIFRGYGGHYHADHRLDREKCDEIYPSWAYRSCISPQVADQVLVSEYEARLAGFVTLKLNNSGEGEVPLYGVRPGSQGRGIGRSLIIGALNAFRSRGAEHMVISTQITNLASQKVWIRLGFEPAEVFYTFHKWFD